MLHSAAPNILLSRFNNKQFLSDIILKLPHSEKGLYAHKVIVAAGSFFLNAEFEKDPSISELLLPKQIQTQFPNTDEGIAIVMEYLYQNQV